MIDCIKSVEDVSKDKKKIYDVLDALGITYKKSNCRKCLKDLKNIALEELGLIDNAADESDFNGTSEWVYVCNRPQSWNGYIIDQDTDPKIIEQFVKSHPVGYYAKKKDNK